MNKEIDFDFYEILKEFRSGDKLICKGSI